MTIVLNLACAVDQILTVPAQLWVCAYLWKTENWCSCSVWQSCLLLHSFDTVNARSLFVYFVITPVTGSVMVHTTVTVCKTVTFFSFLICTIFKNSIRSMNDTLSLTQRILRWAFQLPFVDLGGIMYLPLFLTPTITKNSSHWHAPVSDNCTWHLTVKKTWVKSCCFNCYCQIPFVGYILFRPCEGMVQWDMAMRNSSPLNSSRRK